MDYKQSKEDIKQALSKLHIPKRFQEDAQQVAWVAYLEEKDVTSVVRKWLRSETTFEDKLQKGDNMKTELENPNNNQRRIDTGAVPRFVSEVSGDEVEMVEKI